MPLFRRRRRGRHEAVPVRRRAPLPLPVEPPPWEVAEAQPWVSVVPAVPEAAAGHPAPAVQAALPSPSRPAEASLRVELGFRDGTMAVLHPDSAQARALTALAEVLTRRD